MYEKYCIVNMDLLPTGSEEHEVLLFGNISERILQAHHQIVQTEKHTKILVKLGSNNKKHLRGSTRATIQPWSV